MASIKLRVLGHPAVELDGDPVVFETRKALAILVYLAFSPYPVSREYLASLFWPELPPAQTLGSLRRNLSSLAHCLKDMVLDIDRKVVGFKDQVEMTMDIQEFRQKIHRIQDHPHTNLYSCQECLDAFEQGIQLVRGEFLEGFNLKDCPEFGDWQYQQRLALQQELRQALDDHIRISAAQHQWGKAVLSGQRLVALDCLDEASHRKLMWLYVQDNRRNAALNQYKVCAQILLKELNQKPEPKTSELFQNIRNGNPIHLHELQPLLEYVPESAPVEHPLSPALQREQPIDQILRTKLFIPSVRTVVVNRPFLVNQINQGVQGALTLVSAPAGFGKTTLLASWAAQPSAHVGWISLDPEDNDASRFWTYFIAGLRAIQPDVGQVILEMLKSPQPLPPKTILTALINEISSIPHPFILILDDYHVITSQPIHNALTFLLDHMPPNLHLIIATRADPLLPLARLRAQNQLVNLRGEDLRLKTDEIAEFMNKLIGLGLSDQEIALLEERTEGWVVGLQMAALSMQGREDLRSFIQSFHGTHQYILDYLTDEVLNQLPQEIQLFLLQTSILERLCAPLCNFITTEKGVDGASSPIPSNKHQSILEYLDRSNLFIVSLDNDRCWYRYHNLFANLLSSRLQQSQPENVPVLHRRASEWYEQNDLFNEAIHHALTARDYERAAELVEKIALFFIGKCELGTLINWFIAFPKELFHGHPWLCIYYAWALLLKGQVENVEMLINLAEQATQAGPSSINSQELTGNIEGIRIYTYLLDGRIAQAIELVSRVRGRLPDCSPVTRCIIEYTIAAALITSNNLIEANRSFQNAARIALELGNTYLAILALADLAGVYKIQGQLHKAELLYQEIHQLHTKSSPQPFILPGILEADLGELLLEWNCMEEASIHIQNGITSNLEGGSPSLLALSYLHQVRLLLAKKKIPAAWKAFYEAEQISQESQLHPRTYQLLDSWRLRLWLAERDFTAVNQWVQQQKILPLRPGPSIGMVEEIGIIAQARGLIALERYAEAFYLLEQLAQYAEDGGRSGSLIEILAVQALAYRANHNASEAYKSLERALFLAQPEGYVRIFVDEGEPMRLLLQKFHSEVRARKLRNENLDRLSEYVNKLLAAFSPAPKQKSKDVDNWQSTLVEPLTSRELEVLQLLCAGLSNQEIAEKLFLTNSTVKSHIHHIFDKTDVESRTQLIVLAKELKLI